MNINNNQHKTPKELNFDNIIDKCFHDEQFVALSESEISELEINLLNSTAEVAEIKEDVSSSKIINWIELFKDYISGIMTQLFQHKGKLRPALAALAIFLMLTTSYFIFFNNGSLNYFKQDNQAKPESEQNLSQKKFQIEEKSIVDDKKISDLNNKEYLVRKIDEMLIFLPTKAFSEERNQKAISDSALVIVAFDVIKRVLGENKIGFEILQKNNVLTNWYYFRNTSKNSIKQSRLLIKEKPNDKAIEFIEEYRYLKIEDTGKSALSYDNLFPKLIDKIKMKYHQGL